MNDRQLLWQQKLAEVSKLRDEADKGIDEGIKETVAALQLLGLQTIQSCEGHLDRGKQTAPWVDIESPEVRALRSRIWELSGASAKSRPLWGARQAPACGAAEGVAVAPTQTGGGADSSRPLPPQQPGSPPPRSRSVGL
jgi:hypothetical protein